MGKRNKGKKKRNVKTVDWGYRWFVFGFFAFIALPVGLMINVVINGGVGENARLARKV